MFAYLLLFTLLTMPIFSIAAILDPASRFGGIVCLLISAVLLRPLGRIVWEEIVKVRRGY